MARIKKGKWITRIWGRDDTVPQKVLIVKYSPLKPRSYGIIFSNYSDWELLFAANGLDAMDRTELRKDVDLIISYTTMSMM